MCLLRGGGGVVRLFCFVSFLVCCFPALRSKQEKGRDRHRQTDRKSSLYMQWIQANK